MLFLHEKADDNLSILISLGLNKNKILYISQQQKSPFILIFVVNNQTTFIYLLIC